MHPGLKHWSCTVFRHSGTDGYIPAFVLISEHSENTGLQWTSMRFTIIYLYTYIHTYVFLRLLFGSVLLLLHFQESRAAETSGREKYRVLALYVLICVGSRLFRQSILSTDAVIQFSNFQHLAVIIVLEKVYYSMQHIL